MKPGVLMTIGASIAALNLALSFIAEPTSGAVVMVFAAGALFGKGYGVWEERGREALEKESEE